MSGPCTTAHPCKRRHRRCLCSECHHTCLFNGATLGAAVLRRVGQETGCLHAETSTPAPVPVSPLVPVLQALRDQAPWLPSGVHWLFPSHTGHGPRESPPQPLHALRGTQHLPSPSNTWNTTDPASPTLDPHLLPCGGGISQAHL